MTTDIENRLRAEMPADTGSRSDWAEVERRATRRRIRRVRGLRLTIASFAAVLGVIALAPSYASTPSFEPALGGTIEDDYRLPALLALLLTAVVALLLAGTALRNGSSRSTGWRRIWPALSLVPLTYPLAQLTALESPWSMAAQFATIPCFPLLFLLLAERIGENPLRALVAAGLWSSIGVTMVLGTVALTDEILLRTNDRYLWRLWPGKGQEMPGLDVVLGPEWTVDAIARRELIAVVLIAILTAISLRIIGPNRPGLAALGLPVIVYLGLATYELATPWGFHIDFDFFISDAVLGSVVGDLTFPVGPLDLVSSVALGFAALSMGLLLWSWGGPAPSQNRTQDE